jgi:predicted site-specific integrase-resolvase
MTVRHLNQVDLARRWSLSPRTLERWRWMGEGPAYLKIGGRVAYRLEDIERYERERLHRLPESRTPAPATGGGYPA